MKVKELKELLATVDDESEVEVIVHGKRATLEEVRKRTSSSAQPVELIGWGWN